MPYFNPTSVSLHSEPTSYESCKVPYEKGYIVYYTYASYDSMGPSEGLTYSVLKMYDSYEEAATSAKLLRQKVDQSSRCTDYNVDGVVVYALGWGSSIQDIYVDYVEMSPISLKREF